MCCSEDVRFRSTHFRVLVMASASNATVGCAVLTQNVNSLMIQRARDALSLFPPYFVLEENEACSSGFLTAEFDLLPGLFLLLHFCFYFVLGFFFFFSLHHFPFVSDDIVLVTVLSD